MAKRNAAKTQPAKGQTDQESVEPMVIALAEQLGTFLGRVQGRADGWLENETLRQQVSQIRDGATNLLKQVDQSTAAVRKSAAAGQIRDGASSVMKTVTSTSAAVRKSATKATAKMMATVKPKAKAKQPAAPAKVKGRSGGAVDAPGKKHRKPPPQERVDRHLSKPGKPMGQNGAKGRMQRGGSDR